MKDEAQSLVDDINILLDGLIISLEKGKIQESSDYVRKMKSHLDKVQEYLKMKKSIDEK